LALPTTQIGGIEVSRLCLGSNPFFGFSHKTAARDVWLKRYFTDERIYEIMLVCAELGVNLFVSGPQPRFADLRKRLEDETGFHMHWACTPGGSDLQELKVDIERTRALGAEICLPHTCWIEAHLRVGEREVADLKEALDTIRDAGMVPGVSTHRPEVLPIAAERGYDSETFILPFNVLGYLCPFEIEWQNRILAECPKPIISIKAMAAGRLTPVPGLTFVYPRIKPIDTVCVGVLSPEELREDVEIAQNLMAGQPVAEPLSVTRSKEHLRAQR